MSSLFNHGYALLIGVGESAYPKLSLPVTVRDVQALKATLVNPDLCAYPDTEQHVRLLQNHGATKQAIMDELDWLQEQAINDPKATILIYYSGHGWLDTASQKYYLLQHDIDPLDWQGTALLAGQFKQSLREIQPRRLLVIIDSCHAQGMAGLKGVELDLKLPPGIVRMADPKGLIEELGQGEGRVVFTSCRGEQRSWIRADQSLSLYTYHLIEALQGSANQPSDTTVTISNLMTHLAKTVPSSAQAMGVMQTPRFEFDTEDFAIAQLRGGKGLTGEEVWKTEGSQESQQVQNSANVSGDSSVGIAGNSNASVVAGSDSVVQQGTGHIQVGSIGQARDISIESQTQEQSEK